LGGTSSAIGNASVQTAEITFNADKTFSDDFSFTQSGVAFGAGVVGSAPAALGAFGTATALANAGRTTGSLLAQGLAPTTTEQVVLGAFSTAVDVGVGTLANEFLAPTYPGTPDDFNPVFDVYCSPKCF
jgi:hypothetical protein